MIIEVSNKLSAEGDRWKYIGQALVNKKVYPISGKVPMHPTGGQIKRAIIKHATALLEDYITETKGKTRILSTDSVFKEQLTDSEILSGK